jgi:hypothetical protein
VEFFISKGERFQFKLGFNLTPIIDLALMVKIRNFLLNLPAKEKTNQNFEGKVINLNISQSKPNR